jgi:hypothetical protein
MVPLKLYTLYPPPNRAEAEAAEAVEHHQDELLGCVAYRNQPSEVMGPVGSIQRSPLVERSQL